MKHTTKDYRPTMDDFTVSKAQTLSLKDAGQFDKKFHLATADGKVTARRATTGWRGVCLERQAQGISRQARIKARKEAQ